MVGSYRFKDKLKGRMRVNEIARETLVKLNRMPLVKGSIKRRKR